jgi:hypothetical protein
MPLREKKDYLVVRQLAQRHVRHAHAAQHHIIPFANARNELSGHHALHLPGRR